MASSSKKDDDFVTKHIEDYYKKFSNNKDLPKYFSGTSISYLPEIEGDSDSEPNDNVVVNTDIDIVITPAEEPEEEAGLSPSSSIVSNRKLEWDNGADIGYDNCQRKRSSSLPVSMECLQQGANNNDIGRSEVSSSSASNVKLVIYTHSSSSEPNDPPLNVNSSSSSSSHEEKKVFSCSSSSAHVSDKVASNSSSDLESKKQLTSFKSTLSFLKKKIGLPDAQSTPFVVEEKLIDVEKHFETPVAPKTEKPIRRLRDDLLIYAGESSNSESGDKTNNKPAKLKSVLKKPNTDSYVSKPRKKVVTLCLTKPLTVECTCSPQKPKNKVIQVKSKQSTIGIQTDSISEKDLIKIISKTQDTVNQSVVYYQHSGSNNNTGSTQTSSDIIPSNCDSFEYVKNVNVFDTDRNNINHRQVPPSTSRKESLASNVAITESTSQNLAQIGDSNESSELHLEKCTMGAGTHIERNIELLQKLLRSKKYDPPTKKRYIKKLIQNIKDSKFLEDSSTSSELFFPKKTSNPVQHDVKPASTETSSEGNIDPKGKKQTKLAIKTFSHNISPRKPSGRDELTSTSEIIPVEVNEFRKNIFTLTNNEFSVNQPGSHRPNSNEYASLEKQYESSSSARSYRNWKDDRTLSERLYDGKHSSGDGNSLAISDDKERKNQLVWIDNEIQQLEKMRKLLSKPQADKYTARKTSVYRVERNTPSKKPRKYIIETQLSGRVSKHINYNIDGKKYSVKNDDLKNKDNNRLEPLMGDIEVESSDTTMKIKVTTFCQVCKRSPCVCVTDFLGGLANPFERPGNSVIGDQDSCSCASRTSSTKTVCLICHKKICICKSNVSRRCSVCQLSPCSCSCGYTGQFLPAKPPKAFEEGYSNSSKSSKSKSMCSKCRSFPCSCQKMTAPVASDLHTKTDATPAKSSVSENGSLKKVFENCTCNAETTCSCYFVEKLLKHFNVKSTETVQPKADPGEHIGIQTSFEIENKNLQTSKNDEDKTSQTDAKTSCNCQTISVQTQFDTKSQNSQTVQKNFDSKIIQTDMLSLQFEFGQMESVTNRKEVLKSDASTNVDLNKKEHTSKLIQTADVPKMNVAEQFVVDSQEACTDPLQRFDKFVNAVIGSKDIRKPFCNCSQSHASTYPVDKRSQLRNSKSDKRIQFIGSDTELVKAQRKQSIGCNCNITMSDVYPNSSIDDLHYTEAIKTNNYKIQKKVETTSVGTCRCGFSDKIYTEEIPTKKAPDIANAPAEIEVRSATSSTNSGTERTATSDNSSSGPSVTCISCDQSRSAKKITILVHNNREFPLCSDCLERRPMLTASVCYTGAEQSSNISSEIDKKSHESKDTTVQTENDEYCTCTKPTLVNNSGYCSHCLNRLKKTMKSKNGIAYTLTLENDSPSKFRSKKRKKKPLEEIKVKVPGPHGRKKAKDSENFNRRSVDRFKRMGRSAGDRNNINSNKDTTSKESGEPVQVRRGLTLQDYLKQNRPEFFNSAEYRRQTVNDYRVIRELTKDQVKLKFLEENLQNDELNKHRKLFSEKEMKEITKRNYKKLPEVQQKLTDDKYRRLRTADKFIVDTFAKKIQKSVLKGKRDFPLDTNIVSIVV